MKIRKVARILVGTAALCWVLASAGCGGTTSSSENNASATSADTSLRADWGTTLQASGTVGVGMFPAKYTFEVTATPSCALDFAAYNTSYAGVSGSKPNIVAFNQLYSTQNGATPAGLCGTAGPSTYWSYFTGTGQALTSPVLSGDGSKVAFVENFSGSAAVRILKWVAGQGTVSAPVAPDTTLTGTPWSSCPANKSCVVTLTIAFQDTNSPPFYDYNTDSMYVGDNHGGLHKVTGVFNGTPTLDPTGWPIAVSGATAIMTGPVYDGVSGNIYVGDNGGRLFYVRETGSTVGACTSGAPPCKGATTLTVGTGGEVIDAPIVDGTNQTVFAVNATATDGDGNFGVLLQTPTSFASSVQTGSGGLGSIGSAMSGTNLYGGDFDNAYYSSSKPSLAGHMYFCGKDTSFNDRPAIYQLTFNTTTAVISSISSPLSGMTDTSGEACSPVTEFYNTTTSTDWIFFSIGNNANNGAPINGGSTCRTSISGGTVGHKGCIISINVTPPFTFPPSAVTHSAAAPSNTAGATSGFVIDNNSASTQASSVYFSLGANSSGTGPGLPSCNTTAGVGCAVKLTQSGLN